MRHRTTAAALAITGLLALPAGALAGGWATVGLSSTPDGVAAGAAWNVELEILQHGRTPLDGVHPTVTISSSAGAPRTFTTQPAGRPGIYRARVTFPHGGRWRYVVDDGFTARHTYPAVRIGGRSAADAAPAASSGAAPAPANAGDGTIAWGRLVLAALAGLAAAALAHAVPGVLRSRASRSAATSGG